MNANEASVLSHNSFDIQSHRVQHIWTEAIYSPPPDQQTVMKHYRPVKRGFSCKQKSLKVQSSGDLEVQ